MIIATPFEDEEDDKMKVIDVMPKPELSLGQEFGRGLDRGMLQTGGLGYGLLGALGAATGVEDLEEFGYSKAQEMNEAASVPELQGDVMSIFDVGSPGDFMHYAAGIMGSQVPNLAVSVATGGIGGAIGKRAVSAAITEALEAKTKQLVGQGVSKEIAQRQAQLALSREMGTNLAEKMALEKAAQTAAMKTGATVGAGASSVGMEVGSVYSDTRDLGLSLKYGVPAGLVEGIANYYFGGKVVDAIQGSGGWKGVKQAGKEIGKGSLIEGGTEGVQTGLELQALEESGVEPGFKVASEEGAKRIFEGAAAGVVMGGGMGVGVQGTNITLAPLTQRALQDLEVPPSGQEQSQTGDPQESTQEEQFYNFSPDEVAIDDGEERITARRFSIGDEQGWAIDNPSEEMRQFLPPLGNTGKVALLDGGKGYGREIRHRLDNGGWTRGLDPSLLDNKMTDDRDQWEGYSASSLQDNQLSGGTDQSGQTGDAEVDAENRAFEDRLISRYSQLTNVINAVDLLESTGAMPQGSLSGQEREALGGELNSEERSSILAAVSSQELSTAKKQVDRLLAGIESKAATDRSPELQRQWEFLTTAKENIQDFENLKISQQLMNRAKAPQGAEGELSPGVSKTNPVEERALEWAAKIQRREQARRDLDAAMRLRDDAEDSADYEALEAYEMLLEDSRKAAEEIKQAEARQKKAAKAGDTGAAEAAKREIAAARTRIAQAEIAARDLISESSNSDVFANEVRKTTRAFAAYPKRKALVEQRNKYSEKLDALQAKRDFLVAEEDIQKFDASREGRLLKSLPAKIDEINQKILPTEDLAKIYANAAAITKARREESGRNAARRAERNQFAESEAELARRIFDDNSTDVIYRDPATGYTTAGVLVGTDEQGNFLMEPKKFDSFAKNSLGENPSDLNDTKTPNDGFVRIPRGNINSVYPDRVAPVKKEIEAQAKSAGVENAEQNNPLQNATAIAAELNARREAEEKKLESSITPIFTKTESGDWRTQTKRGENVGLRLGDQSRVQGTLFLQDGTRLVPTNAGVFQGVQSTPQGRRVGFDRYYIAKPPGGKETPVTSSLAMPQLRKGEKLITLSNLSDEQKEQARIPKTRGGKYQTTELVSEDLWDDLYKAPKSAVFKRAETTVGGFMPSRPERPLGAETRTMQRDEGDKSVYTFESDLTDAEEILTLALGKFSTAPTREELLSVGLTPTGETAEFETGQKSPTKRVETYTTTIKDPISKSGLDIPVTVGLFQNKKNPDAPLQVKMFAEFDPSAVYAAQEELEAKRNAPEGPLKNANIRVAEKSLEDAVQDLKRLTLAQMNMGLDVRVREINGIPETQFVGEFGFIAEKSGGKKGSFGNSIVTEVSYSPNPTLGERESVFRRQVQKVGQTQQQAAMTLTDMTRKGRGFDYKKSGLGVGNTALENWRRQKLDQAQTAKEKEKLKMEEGSDLASRHADALTRLTAFTSPLFEKYAAPMRKHIEEAPNVSFQRKERWRMESELRLARELNKLQLEAMPVSVAEKMQKEIATAERNAEKTKPVRGKRRVLRKGKDFGKLMDDPSQSERKFQRLERDWRQKLEQEKAGIEQKYFNQMLPRVMSGRKGVIEINALNAEIDKIKSSIRQNIADTAIEVSADPAEISARIKKDREIKKLKTAFTQAKGKAAKDRWKKKLEDRKAQIEKNATTKRKRTEEEIEREYQAQIKQNPEIPRLEREIRKLNEFSPDQQSLISRFLDFVQEKADKSKDQTRKALTENLRVLFDRREKAAKEGRKVIVKVAKETKKAEGAANKRRAAAIREEISKRTDADEEIKSLEQRIKASTPEAREALEKQRAERRAEIEAPIRAELKTAFVNTDVVEGQIERAVRADEEIKRIDAELKQSTPEYIDSLKSRLEDAKKGIIEDVNREFTSAGGFAKEIESEVSEVDSAIAEYEERLDNAVKAMEFAQATGNEKMFAGAAADFAEASKKKPSEGKKFTEQDRNLIEAFGSMMDQIKNLNIFGTTGNPPGILRQGFTAAMEYADAVESQTFYDPETGDAVDAGSEVVQNMISGQADPLALEPFRRPREKTDSEERQSYLEDLAVLRLNQLAEERLGKLGLPVDPNLVELAVVKLFGGRFQGEVAGQTIDQEFQPLPAKYREQLIRSMERKSELTEMIAESVLDNYLFNPENNAFTVPKNESVITTTRRVPAGRTFATEITSRTTIPNPGPEAGLYGVAESAPGAGGTDVAQSNKNATAQPNRRPIQGESRAVAQSFVQSYTGMSDSDMVALSDSEIDSIYQAATSKAEADLAVGAVDAVVAVSPGLEEISQLGVRDLVKGYLRELAAEQARGDAETILRENLRKAAVSRMFKSNNDFLEHVASQPKGISRSAALRAKEFLKLNDKGSFDWNKIATQIAAFGKNGKQATWAGLMGTDMESGGHAIYINLDQIHEGDVIETLLEEMDHVLTYRLNNAERFGIKLNPVQEKARERLRTDFKRAVLKAGEGMPELVEQTRGMTPEQKVEFFSRSFGDLVAQDPEQFRAYYNLANFDEFVVGIKKDGAFIDLLKELGFNEKASGGFSITGFLKDIFTALAELVTGRRLDPGSELARAFSDSWTLSTGRDTKQWAVPPTKLAMALGIESASVNEAATGKPEVVRMRGDKDSVYNAYLQENEDGSWSVIGEWGNPAKKLQQATKSKGKLNYAEAKSLFDKTVKAKSEKYSIIPDQGPDDGGSTTPPQGPAPQGPQSAPGRRQNIERLLLGKKEGTTYTGEKVQTGGWFSSDAKSVGDVSAMFDRKTNRESFGREKADFYSKVLSKALKKYGGQVAPQDVNDALGSIENPLTEAQAKEIDELIATRREGEAAVLKDEYRKANVEDFRRRQQAAMSRLPKEVAEIVGEMREAVDSLSKYANDRMGFSVDEQMGIYLNRTYLNFADEKTRAMHQKQVRENPVLMDSLRNLLARQLAEQDAEALIKRATREGRILPRAEAEAEALANLSPTDLAAAMERVINYGEKGVGSLFVSGRIPGQKNLKIFDARGNIDPVIQEVWGVVKDPGANFANTVIKLSNLVANDRFLNEIKESSLETGMLYDPRDPKNLTEEDAARLAAARSAALEADPELASRSRFKPELLDRAMAAQDPVVASILEEAERKIPAGYVKLSADTNKSLAPISGMYAEKSLFDWMTTKFPPNVEDSLWMKALTQLTLVPMAMKTVGSVAGQFRNYYSGYMSLLAGGNLRPWDAQWREDFKNAHRMTFGPALLGKTPTDASARKALIKARERLSELGLLNQSVSTNFMQDLARLDSTGNKALGAIDSLVQRFIKTYGASDDNFKLIHYFSELGKYRRAFPDMSQAELEERAAAIARGIHQTYGDTYAAVKALKKVPFIAPFISFTSEVIRNTVNLARLTRNEIREGRATGNRELELIGYSRLAGMGLAGGGTFALSAFTASLVGIDGDEERDFRKLLPEWQKNNQFLFLGKKDGKISFVDFGFSDPFSYLKTPVIAFSRSVFDDDDRDFNEKLGEGLLEGIKSAAAPFLAEQLFSGSVMQLYSNKDGSGRQIVNWQDSPGAIAASISGHLVQPFLPGTYDTGERIVRAFTGFVSPSGRSFDVGNELVSTIGFRMSGTDVRQSLGFKAKAFMQNYREAATLFSGPFLSRGTQSEESVMQGYESANDAIRRLSQEFRDTYLGAIRLGVPEKEVLSILKANGISDRTLKMLRTGIIPPYEASKQSITKNRESGMTDRIVGYNKAYAEAKKP